MSRLIYKSFLWQFLTVVTSYLIAYLLKFIAINTTPLAKYQLFEKVPVFLDGLHIGALKCAYWLLVAVLIEVVVFVLIQLKNRNLGRLVRSTRFENELNNFYKNNFNLKTRVFLSDETVVIRIAYPRDNEELQQFKKYQDDIRAQIISEFNEYSFPQKFEIDNKRKSQILEGLRH